MKHNKQKSYWRLRGCTIRGSREAGYDVMAADGMPMTKVARVSLRYCKKLIQVMVKIK
jgi:hypothetical protein